MPALALISRDSRLYQQVSATLEGTGWSVEWLAPDAASEGPLSQDVLLVDGLDPEVRAWSAPRGKPTLMIVDEAVPDGLEHVADDIVFRPAQRAELTARLARLLARSPLESLRRTYAKTFASMTLGIVVIDPDNGE